MKEVVRVYKTDAIESSGTCIKFKLKEMSNVGLSLLSVLLLGKFYLNNFLTKCVRSLFISAWAANCAVDVSVILHNFNVANNRVNSLNRFKRRYCIFTVKCFLQYLLIIFFILAMNNALQTVLKI